MKLKNLLPLKEDSTGAFGATSEELADMYSLKMLQQFRDELMMDMENDPSVEPEGGPRADYYGGTLNGLDKAIAIKKGETKDVPYDVAIGRMSRDEFEKSSKFNRMNEQDTRFTVDGKPVDLGSIEMGGLEMMRKYGPDDGGPDAYIESAYFLDGTELTDVQIDEFMEKYPDITYEKALDQYLQEGKVCESCGQMHEGSCGYTHTTDGSKLRTPGGTKGMSADKRTMTMMREAIRKEIKKLYGNK